MICDVRIPLFQPPPSEDYSGELLEYRILLDKAHVQICAAASSLCLLQAPAEVQAVSVAAVTSYGTSPPASVDFRHTGELRLQCSDQQYALRFKY